MRKTAILCLLLVLCLTLSLFQVVSAFKGGANDPIYVNGYEEVSGKPAPGVIGWGIKRNGNGKLPDADPGAPALLAKYDALYLGDPNEKTIYLTFDEGYENGYTAQILDVLKANGVKAIFFITGDYLKTSSDLVQRMVEEGHEVGNHTYNHPSLPTCSQAKIEEELLSLDREFNQKFSKNMRFLRPPKGEYSEFSLSVTKNLSYINVFWSFAYADWDPKKQKGTEYAYKMVTENLHNGAVLLLHAVSKDNANALDSILKAAKEAGYTFGTPDQLAEYARQGNTASTGEPQPSISPTTDPKAGKS